jgi:purine-binding chemotaxis protein CheW
VAAGTRYVHAWAGGIQVAFPITVVREVLPVRAITPLFHAPAALLGVVNVRGEILPAIDLASLLELGDPSTGPEGGARDERLLILRGAIGSGVEARSVPFAVRVAGLAPLLDVGSAGLDPLPAGLPPSVARLACGVVPTSSPAAVVLDLAKILASPALLAVR